MTEGRRLLVNATKPKATDDVADLISEMRDDEVGLTVKSDDLILMFGKKLCEAFRNIEGIRKKMRHLARLSIQLRKQDGKLMKQIMRNDGHTIYGEGGLMEYMVPEKFDEVVRATEALCTENKDPETGNAVHTGIPLGIGQSLRKVCAVLRCIGLRKEFTAEGKQILQKTAQFLNLLDSEWDDKIVTKVQRAMHDRKLNKIDVLPVTADVKKLVDGVKGDMQHLVKRFKEDFTQDVYRMLEEIVLVRLIIFNMRRTSEASRMTIKNWYDAFEAQKDFEDSEILASLTDLEKRMADNFLLVKIRGIRGKKVCPCIIPPDAQEPIKLLIENRAKGGIREDSQMVFGVPTSDAGYIPSHYVLKKFAKIYCDDPEKVTSTKLRKFLATACQMLDLGETGKDYLASHLGKSPYF